MLKLASIVFFLIMCYLFFMPATSIPKVYWMQVIHFDKWVHTGLFAIFVALATLAFAKPEVNNTHIVIFLGSVFYGFMVEIIQLYFIMGRSFSYYDIFADIIGAIIGAKWAYKILRKQ